MSSQMTSQSPRQGLNPRQAETVERLLAAGLDELRLVGHESLTVRTVAQRAGVSPATAYTYLASKNHLFAELFWRHLAAEPALVASGSSATERVQGTVRALVARIVAEPELATAVTPALLGTDQEVDRLRIRIGSQFVTSFERALIGPDGTGPADPDVLEALVLSFSGALLQVGMGMMGYDAMADRVESIVAVILRGNA